MMTHEDKTLLREIELLKEELKCNHMTLAAIRMLAHNNRPICSKKMAELLDTCEGCKDKSTLRE